MYQANGGLSHQRYGVYWKHGKGFFIQDPYCKIYLGGQLNRTQIKEEGGKNPRWRDSFYYTLQPNSDPTLKVEVWDDDPGSD